MSSSGIYGQGGKNTPAKVIGKALAHDSAHAHVTGAARYVDDIPEPTGILHVVPGLCRGAAVGEILQLDLTSVKNAAGVVCVLTAADIPGENDCSPGFGGDPVMAQQAISFHGQVVFAVVATSRKAARRAAKLAFLEVEKHKPVVHLREAIESSDSVLPDYAFGRGDIASGMARSVQQVELELDVGGQDHFYLEGQVAMALPQDGGALEVYSSTQHPSEVQHTVAKVLDLPESFVNVNVRRLGGGFGGKESQANQWATLAALAAHKTGRPCKCRLDRDDDMIATGKRHDFLIKAQAGVDEQGRIEAVTYDLASRCGHSADLSLGINDRAMFHLDNAYYYPEVHIKSRRLKTDSVSNTAFRGFGGPQGMLAAERLMDAVASARGRDPLDIRYANLYGQRGTTTPYGMAYEEADTLQALLSQLEARSRYRERRVAVTAFNEKGGHLRRGLALTPVKFGISFTLTELNQAGALVHLYRDGSVHLNHGGTEMGQGLYQKIAQVASQGMGVCLDKIHLAATSTGKVPNTSATAASSGTDLNAMAVLDAIGQIQARLKAFLASQSGAAVQDISFSEDQVLVKGKAVMQLAQLAKQAHQARISLSAQGFFRTPRLDWDRESASGRPFYYFAHGAACAQVLVDTLSGEMRLEAVHILQDVGHSLNPAIDRGQIEGGFVQGLGWLTSEELVFDDAGRLRTHAPSTYKIPCARDVPAAMEVELFNSAGNPEDVVNRSKAVGEPPVMLANAVFCAIGDALHSLAPGHFPQLRAPATPEEIWRCAQAQKELGGAKVLPFAHAQNGS
ncbi:xanthine dehydrogenase molybdopterin binding subunit [Polycladidibacter hongkongensis]|uniref:xanthine dehydrogenase molybdopterin binding subunit n=1 Tax=Polycladidibacter hongkongensis TaxID=1647556 RepID=UPI00082E954C|nr:xanthine dehydrogenase molybdopterin binding subunit [Pseudovibrio hongkongensis]